VKGAVNKIKKKFEKDLYENAKKNPKAIRDLSVFKFWRSVKTISLLITRSFSSY
jgi:hypothetical protein